MAFLSYATLGLIAASLVIYHVVSRIHAHRVWSKIPTHTFTGAAGKKRYVMDLKELLRTGYSKYSKAGEVFKIHGSDGVFRIVLPRAKLEEIKNASARTFSWQLQSRQVFQIHYTGVPDRGPWSAKALRVDLHKHLDDLVLEMSAIISAHFDQQLTRDSEQWQSVNVLQLFRSCVARITNHAFCGPALNNDPEWVEATMRFTADSFGAAAEIRGYPSYLRPFAAFFLRSIKSVSSDKKFAKRKLGPLFRQRTSARKNPEFKAPDDGFQRILDAAPPNIALEEFAGTMMRVMMASVHTTAHTAAIALGDLISQPQYIAGLSQEMCESFGGNRIQIQDCDQLRLLDSFLKESQRITPLFLLNVARITRCAHVFEDGLYIPAGTCTTTAAEAISADPEIFPNPDEFDGNRFYKLRQQDQGAEKRFQFGMASEESVNFGYGAQACPGRFFAALEIKLLFVKLLLDYDIKCPEGMTERPAYKYMDFFIEPPASLTMLVKRKKKADRAFPSSS